MPRGSVGDKKMSRKRKAGSDSPIGPVDESIKNAIKLSNDDSPSPPSPPYNNNSSGIVDIHTPPNATQLPTPLSNSANVSIRSAGRSIPMLEAGSVESVHLDLEDGDYVVRVKRRSITSSTNECNVEVTKKLAQSAGMLFFQAEIFRDMGEQLLAQYRTSLQNVMRNTASRISLISSLHRLILG